MRSDNGLRVSFDTTRCELVQHGESSLWLVHWNHVAGLEDSQEFEILVGLEVTSWLVVDIPFSIVGLLEVRLSLPLASISPSFSSFPVTNEIFVA
jgi:hypothetical protein